MVRVNLVEPSTLTDQHLIAEHNEILMLCGSFKKSLNSKKGISGIPEQFKLGKGHIKFFYNKGEYLHIRFCSVQEEMRRRGFNPQKSFPIEIWPDQYYNDWEPTESDIMKVVNRIQEKIIQKPNWYKYYGKSINEKDNEGNL